MFCLEIKNNPSNKFPTRITSITKFMLIVISLGNLLEGVVWSESSKSITSIRKFILIAISLGNLLGLVLFSNQTNLEDVVCSESWTHHWGSLYVPYCGRNCADNQIPRIGWHKQSYIAIYAWNIDMGSEWVRCLYRTVARPTDA